MILVTGATGNIGSALTRMLVSAGHATRALTRDARKAATTLGGRVTLVEGDLARPETLRDALAGVDKAFFLATAGHRLAEVASVFLDAAKSAGVRHVVAVSSGTTVFDPPVAIGRWHRAMEERLEASGLAWTMLRPGNFASNALRWAGTIRAQGAVFAPHGDVRTAPIHPRDIAAVAFEALTRPGHEGKAHALTGPTLMSPRDQVAAIAEVIGKPVRFVEVPEAQARAAMVGGGLPELMVDAVLELVRPGTRGQDLCTTTVRDVTGREARSFADWVRDNAHAFA